MIELVKINNIKFIKLKYLTHILMIIQKYELILLIKF